MESPKAQSASTRVKETREKQTSGHLSKWKFLGSVIVMLAAVGYYLDCIKVVLSFTHDIIISL